jgi:WD40 repeat protein
MHVQRLILIALIALAGLIGQPAGASARFELHLLDAASGADRSMVVSAAHEYTPLVFSNSGDALTMLRSGGGHDELQRMSLTDGSRTRLSSQRLPGGSDPLPAVSVDGRLVSPSPIVRGRTVRWHVWIARLNGHVITWLPRHYIDTPSVSWPPDGKRVVVVGPHAHYHWTLDVFTRTGRLVTSLALGPRPYVQAPQLSPDNMRVLLNLPPSRRRGTAQATVVDLGTGRRALLQPALAPLPSGKGREPLSWATWSPLGNVVLATRAPGLQVELFDAVSLRQTHVLSPPHQVYAPSAVWSPNGQRVLLTEIGDAGDGLLMIDLSSGQPVARELAPIKRGDIVAVVWSHDSRIVAYDRS